MSSSSDTTDCAVDGSFDFFTSETPLRAGASDSCATDEGSAPMDFGGALFDFGDWGTADGSAPTAGGDDATTAAAETSFDLTWGDDPAVDAESTTGLDETPADGVPGEPAPPRSALRVASAMPPPSPLPPKASAAPQVPTTEQRRQLPTPPPPPPQPQQQQPRSQPTCTPANTVPVAVRAAVLPPSQRAPGCGGLPASSGAAAVVPQTSSRAPLRPPAATAAVVPGVSKKAVDELVAEADGLLGPQPRASGGALSDAAFRSAVAAMKQTATSEAQLLADRTAQLLKAAVACIDRVGPNPAFASLVADTQHAGTPVLHLTHLVKPQLLERVHRLRALGF